MLRHLKTFTTRALLAANVAAIVLMAAVGYSDRLDPAAHPLLCNIGLAMPAAIALNLGFLVFWVVYRWKWAIVPLLGFIVCYQPVRNYCPFNAGDDVPSGAIKVLSYNVYMFGDPGERQLGTDNAILQYIVRQEADIVCLQEADANGPMGAAVDSTLNNVYLYRDTSLATKGGDLVRLYSKYPIRRHEHVSRDGTGNHVTAFWLDMNGKTVIVLGCHLQTTGLSPEDRAEFKEMVKGDMKADSIRPSSRNILAKLSHSTVKRAPQAEAVASFVRRHRHESLIVCGDFNDGPNSYTHHTIANDLTDCYIATANGPGISYHKGGFYVRIDNIMCSDNWTPYRCHVDNSIAASDHYPIVCWLKKR